MSFFKRSSRLLNDFVNSADDGSRPTSGSSQARRSSGTYGAYGSAGANTWQGTQPLPPPPPHPQYGQEAGQPYVQPNIQPTSPPPLPPPLPQRRTTLPPPPNSAPSGPPPIPPRPAPTRADSAGPTFTASLPQPTNQNATAGPGQQAQARPTARASAEVPPQPATSRPLPPPPPINRPSQAQSPPSPSAPGSGGRGPPVPPRRPSMPAGASTPTPPNRASGGAPAETTGPDMGDPLGDIITAFPVIRAQGQPLTTFSYCLTDNAVNWETTWYHLPGHESFLMCSACQKRWFGASATSSPFTSSIRGSGRCRFYKARAKVLTAAAARTGVVQPLIDFVARRKSIPDCAEAIHGSQNPNGRWWTPGGGVSSCEACYEDIVLATPLSRAWQLCPAARKCDMAKLGTRAYISMSRSNESIQDWIQTVTYSKSLPLCTQLPFAQTTQWYTTRRPLSGFVICNTCYFTHLKYSRFDAEFVPTAPPRWPQTYTCDMTIFGQIAFETAMFNGDFALFWNAMSMLVSDRFQALERCGTTHLSAGWKMYTLRGADIDFDVCARHYVAMLQPCGVGAYFYPRTDLTPRKCDFVQGSSAIINYILALSETVQKGLILPLRSCIVESVTTPAPCPGFDAKSGATWHGFPDLRICPECWERYGRKGALAGQAQPSVVIAHPTTCGLSSYRMRVKWIDADSDPTDILAYARLRQQAYNTTYLQYKRIKDAWDQKRALADQMAGISLATKGRGAALSIISGSTTEYGNDSLGWYDNSTSYDAAVQWKQYEAIQGEVNRMAPEVDRLYAEWMKVA